MNTLGSSSLQVTDLIIEFSDSSSYSAAIFGNGRNQVPVTVTIGIVGQNGPATGLDRTVLADALSFHYKKNDEEVHKGLPESTSNGEGLFFSLKNLKFNHAKYGNTHAAFPYQSSETKDGVYKITCYLSSMEENANFEIYAKLNLKDTPEFSSDLQKCLNIAILPALQWCKPQFWDMEELPVSFLLDLYMNNEQQPVDRVTFKPIAGPSKRGKLMMHVTPFFLKYKNNTALPPVNVRRGLLDKHTLFYDMQDNTQPHSISTYTQQSAPDQTRNELVLWYVKTEGEGAPVLHNTLKFMIGVDSGGQGKNQRDIYMEIITIPEHETIPLPLRGGITLYRVNFRHENTAFFVTDAPDSHSERDLILDVIDDFGNHGSIQAKIKGRSTPEISYYPNSLPETH